VSRSRIIGFIASLALFAAGCVTEPTRAPGEGKVTLEQVFADLAIPALDFAESSFSGMGPIPTALSTSRCAYRAASQSFDCPPVTVQGVTLTESFTLLDSKGARQSAFDGSTATLRLARSVSGTVVDALATSTIDGEQELYLSDLLGDRHTLNGSSTAHSTRPLAQLDGKLVTTTRTTKLTNIVIPIVPVGTPAAWPLSGKIEVVSSTDSDYLPPYPAPGPIVSKATVTFSGTKFVTFSLVSRFVVVSCTADMTLGLGCATPPPG
jgi:hypothetical protein